MKRRSTFISATNNPYGFCTLAEAYERNMHLSTAEGLWTEGQKIIASERLIVAITEERPAPVRGRNRA